MSQTEWTTLSFGGSSFLCALEGIQGQHPQLKHWQTSGGDPVELSTIRVIRPRLDSTLESAFTQIHWGQEYRCTENGVTRHYFHDGWLEPLQPSSRGTVTAHLLESRPVSLDGVLNAALARTLTLNNRLPLHAAAFQLFDQNVLAIGSSGAGKSTLAAAALNAGGKLVSDDNVFIETGPSECQSAHPLRANASFRKGSLGQFNAKTREQLRPLDTANERKWVLSRNTAAEKFVASATIDQLWVLASHHPQTGKSTPLPATQAFAHLIDATPYASSELEKERSLALSAISRLVSNIPSQWVHTGEDLLTTPQTALKKLLSL